MNSESLGISEEMRIKAKQADLVEYLKIFHPGTVRYAAHPDAPYYRCWRSSQYDSLVFYRSEIGGSRTISQFTRFSTRQTDDGIAYLRQYENYSYSKAVRSLAEFYDQMERDRKKEEERARRIAAQEGQEEEPGDVRYYDHRPGDGSFDD